jgi:transcriptional regulator with XRE-family HTH domain
MPSMTVKSIDRERAAPRTREGRAALVKMTLRLFEHWGLSIQDQLVLLGLSENSRMTLSRYRKGEPLADSPDLLDRVANLLQIHRSLRILFPRNREEVAYRWMTIPNRAFGGRTPVETIREERFFGLLKVRQYLDFERGR